MNIVFACGFSKKLNAVATKHRPPSSALSLAQIGHLCNLAEYKIEITRDRFDSSDYTIYHPDEVHGLEDGLKIIWQARPVGSICIVYYPTLKPNRTRGPKMEVIEEMLLRLASFLPELGYQREYIIHVKENFVIIPDELKYIGDGTFVMYASEFRIKYDSLYHFLKENIIDSQ